MSDSGSSLHANLQGHYAHDAFSARFRLDEWKAAVVVAHEQRHYFDYHLTNYGSWLARFWIQIKSAVPELHRASRLVVPISYMDDPFYQREYGLPGFHSNRPVQVAARLASNLGERISWDRLNIPGLPHGAGGSQQMEALATAFEVGPIEVFGPAREQFQTLSQMPRDNRRWQEQYIWLGNILDALDIGPKPVPLGDVGQVMHTRIWPALLTAALMGRFSDLRVEHFDDDPTLPDRILPSRRLESLCIWLAEKPRDAADTPEKMWEAVNEAAIILWGESILESALAELQYLQEKGSRRLRCRPLVAMRPAMFSSRRRRRLGSRVRAGVPVSARCWVQARRSPASATISSQSWLAAKPCRGRLRSPVSLAQRIRSSQRAL